VTAAKPDHDALYHRFFSDPAIVAQLLREFAAGPWLDGLDLDGLERMNAKFHSDTGERREGDLVWRIPRRDGGDAYVMLLLAFQSTPDPWMVLRKRLVLQSGAKILRCATKGKRALASCGSRCNSRAIERWLDDATAQGADRHYVGFVFDDWNGFRCRYRTALDHRYLARSKASPHQGCHPDVGS